MRQIVFATKISLPDFTGHTLLILSQISYYYYFIALLKSAVDLFKIVWKLKWKIKWKKDKIEVERGTKS